MRTYELEHFMNIAIPVYTESADNFISGRVNFTVNMSAVSGNATPGSCRPHSRGTATLQENLTKLVVSENAGAGMALTEIKDVVLASVYIATISEFELIWRFRRRR